MLTAKELSNKICNGKLQRVNAGELVGKTISVIDFSSCNCLNIQTDDGDVFCIEGEMVGAGFCGPVLYKLVEV